MKNGSISAARLGGLIAVALVISAACVLAEMALFIGFQALLQ